MVDWKRETITDGKTLSEQFKHKQRCLYYSGTLLLCCEQTQYGIIK